MFSVVDDNIHTLITWHLASQLTLSYVTPQCVGILYTLYNPGHVNLWCLQVVPVVYAIDVIPRKNSSEHGWYLGEYGVTIITVNIVYWCVACQTVSCTLCCLGCWLAVINNIQLLSKCSTVCTAYIKENKSNLFLTGWEWKLLPIKLFSFAYVKWYMICYCWNYSVFVSLIDRCILSHCYSWCFNMHASLIIFFKFLSLDIFIYIFNF